MLCVYDSPSHSHKYSALLFVLLALRAEEIISTTMKHFIAA